MATLDLRPMLATDASIVAGLQADSWRTAYRGLLSDAFLAGDVDRERAESWRTRLGAFDEAREFGIIACCDGVPVGFVFVIADVHPTWGTLIDNLHVLTAHRSAGIGARLLAAAAEGIHERGWDRRVHLWVFDANVRARAFYARMGGVEVEQIIKPTADGASAPTARVVWADCADVQVKSAAGGVRTAH
jgi:GNAT superfamily N-acetyltransferase